MKRLWALGDGTVKDILGQLPSPPPPYTTVASIVRNLQRKGYVKARRVGNTYLYRPEVAQETYMSESVSEMVRGYFRNSYKELVSFFVREQKISDEELRDVLRMIEDGGRDGE